jgi:hypothetical protein
VSELQAVIAWKDTYTHRQQDEIQRLSQQLERFVTLSVVPVCAAECEISGWHPEIRVGQALNLTIKARNRHGAAINHGGNSFVVTAQTTFESVDRVNSLKARLAQFYYRLDSAKLQAVDTFALASEWVDREELLDAQLFAVHGQHLRSESAVALPPHIVSRIQSDRRVQAALLDLLNELDRKGSAVYELLWTLTRNRRDNLLKRSELQHALLIFSKGLRVLDVEIVLDAFDPQGRGVVAHDEFVEVLVADRSLLSHQGALAASDSSFTRKSIHVTDNMDGSYSATFAMSCGTYLIDILLDSTILPCCPLKTVVTA